MLHRGELNMAKKSAAKKTVEEVVKEVKDEGIDVKVVAEEPKAVEPKAEKDYKDEDVFLHESGQLGYINKDGNFVPV